jgi:hypothetical protein
MDHKINGVSAWERRLRGSQLYCHYNIPEELIHGDITVYGDITIGPKCGVYKIPLPKIMIRKSFFFFFSFGLSSMLTAAHRQVLCSWEDFKYLCINEHHHIELENTPPISLNFQSNWGPFL